MIHVKAIAAGLLVIALLSGGVICLAKWPLATAPFLALGVAYIIGRGVLEFLPKRT